MPLLTRKGLRAAGILGATLALWACWHALRFTHHPPQRFVDGLSPDDMARLEVAIEAQERRLHDLTAKLAAMERPAAAQARARPERHGADGGTGGAGGASLTERKPTAHPPPPGRFSKQRGAAGPASCRRQAWGKSLSEARFPIEHVAEIPPQALAMCRDLFWNALNTCTRRLAPGHPEAPHGRTFVITGDIDDMWIRDSAAQLHPYIAMTAHNSSMADVVEGLIDRQAFYIDFDPYANAYRLDTNYQFSEAQKKQGRHDYISTWDYELDRWELRRAKGRARVRVALLLFGGGGRVNHFCLWAPGGEKRTTCSMTLALCAISLPAVNLGGRLTPASSRPVAGSGCYYLRMLYTYWRANPQRASQFLKGKSIQRAAQVLLDVWVAEQRHEEDARAPGRGLYRRPRVAPSKGKPWTGSAGLPRNGKGDPVAFTGGVPPPILR